jgi:uncharacterized protein YaaQ
MQVSDYIALFSSIATVLLSIASVINALFNTRMTQGQVEMAIRQRITDSRYRYEEIKIKESESSKEAKNILIGVEKSRLEEYLNAYKEAENILIGVEKSRLEEYLNAYDEACQKYLDGKVDRKRFRKTYYSEIRSLKENFVTNEKLNKDADDYHALIEVYDMFNCSDSKAVNGTEG